MKVDLPKNRDFPIIIRPYPKIMAFYTILFWCSLQNQRKTEKKKTCSEGNSGYPRPNFVY